MSLKLLTDACACYINLTIQLTDQDAAKKKVRFKKAWALFALSKILLTLPTNLLMYRSNRSFNMPPPGIPRAFDTFAVPGRREFDYQSLPGGGEFDPHALRVGNLNCTLDFM